MLTAITLAAQRDVLLDDGRAGLELPLPDRPTIAARHVRPGQPIAVVLLRDGEVLLEEANWGVAPRHVAEPRKFAKRYRTHRVFVERLGTSRVFCPLWRRGQRCAIPFSGYDDFVRGEGARLVRAPAPVAWGAGVYRAPAQPDGSDLHAALVLDDGAPMLVPGEALVEWLDPATEPDAALSLLRGL
ncbi:MAG TPA: SOS response-associated peptidase family protein [Xanthomonadales bacterium]|nr:SOS response-associated peptidase family protein [Xanthomonadales bacterium]